MNLLATQIPYQASSSMFPKTKFGKSYRSFNSEWFKKHSWLHYCETTDSAFCCYCMRSAASSGRPKAAQRVEEAFISRGFKNWKNATVAFKKHELSDHHKH